MRPFPRRKGNHDIEVQLGELVIWAGTKGGRDQAQAVIDRYINEKPKTRHYETSVNGSGQVTHVLYDDDEERDELF